MVWDERNEVHIMMCYFQAESFLFEKYCYRKLFTAKVVNHFTLGAVFKVPPVVLTGSMFLFKRLASAGSGSMVILHNNVLKFNSKIQNKYEIEEMTRYF